MTHSITQHKIDHICLYIYYDVCFITNEISENTSLIQFAWIVNDKAKIEFYLFLTI